MAIIDSRHISLLLDTGATFSALPKFWGPTKPSLTSIVGVEGTPTQPLMTFPLTYILGDTLFTHSLLVSLIAPPHSWEGTFCQNSRPLSPYPHPLLSRDPLTPCRHPLSSSLPSWVFCFQKLLPTPCPDLLHWEIPLCGTSRTLQSLPIMSLFITLKDPSIFPNQPQYHISLIHLQGLKPIISELLSKGLRHPTHSPYNTPILPVKKPNGSYQLVWDLRLINVTVTPIHLVVPNPYTLLSLILGTTTHFTVLDLKDALCLHLD
jgi:hypothetical protein